MTDLSATVIFLKLLINSAQQYVRKPVLNSNFRRIFLGGAAAPIRPRQPVFKIPELHTV